jgi:hypothetical protein
MSSRKSRPKATNRKDLKHLKEFGEAHPADIAGAQRKIEIENAKEKDFKNFNSFSLNTVLKTKI